MKLQFKQKYLFQVVDGVFGGGKTAYLARRALDLWQNYDHVYGNFTVKEVPNYEKLKTLDSDVLFELEPNSLLLISEAYWYLDKRFCMKKENIETSQALMQIRKTKVHQIYDIFAVEFLDFRALMFSNVHIRALGELDRPDGRQGLYVYQHLFVDKVRCLSIPLPKYFVIDHTLTYPYYDTDEIIRK